ncbi:MAG: restriction endonuclease subunit S [Gemmatimonadetes bacterium]|nr:restriction endonuclease subunit S [Gemmatimonadota bacterium]
MMTSDLKPYPAYKDSDVEWLGEVPTHWEILPNRTLFEEVKERDRPEEPMLSVTIKQGVIRQKDLLEDSSKKDNSNLDKSAYKLVRPGDIAYNKMRAWQGSVGASEYQGIVSPAYVVERPRKGVSSHYFHYLLRTPAFAKEAERWSYGITSDMWSLRPEHFKMIYACLPPLTEQNAIVRFLDHADRRIRRYIRAKQELIALLEEQKQAIIHQAVTGQVDVRTGQPYSSYKDSGVEWLGKVPEHWEVRRIGGFCEIGNGSTPARSNQAYWNGGSYPWLNSSSVNQGTVTEAEQFVTETALQECHLPRVPADSVLVGITGQGKTRGMAAVLAIEATINQHVAYITPNNSRIGASPGYLHMCLTAAYTELRAISSASGSTKGALTCEDIKSFRVVLPPVDEQEAVLLAIRRKLANVEGCADLEQRQINLVKEYGTRLIADVVTGKLDVREVTPTQPSVDPLRIAEDLGKHRMKET